MKDNDRETWAAALTIVFWTAVFPASTGVYVNQGAGAGLLCLCGLSLTLAAAFIAVMLLSHLARKALAAWLRLSPIPPYPRTRYMTYTTS